MNRTVTGPATRRRARRALITVRRVPPITVWTLSRAILFAMPLVWGCDTAKTELVDSQLLSFGILRPTAQVRSVAIDQSTDQGATVRIHVELTNTNDVSLPVSEAPYRLAVGEHVFEFTAVPPVTMPAGGSQMFSLTAAFPASGESLRGREYDLSGRGVYEPPGEIRKILTDSNIPLPSVGFSDRGVLE